MRLSRNHRPGPVAGVVGNSKLLATISSTGEILRIFWPRPDAGQHVRHLRQGLYLEEVQLQPFWLDREPWTIRQAYREDSNILVTLLRSRKLGLEVEIRDAVLPGQDLLLRSFTFRNNGTSSRRIRFLTYAAIRFEESPLYNTAFFDADTEAMVFYRRGQYLALAGDRAVTGFGCDKPESLWQELQNGELKAREIHMGDTAGALIWDLETLLPRQETGLTLYLSLEQDRHGAMSKIQAARSESLPSHLARVNGFWKSYLDMATPLPDLPEDIARVYRRSLLTIRLMTGREGGVIAAPEFDPEYRYCGGYAYVWGRDAAYIALALDRAGYPAAAAAIFRWAARTQEPEGFWAQRHDLAGNWGTSWGLIQIDETGSILFGIWQHYLFTREDSFLQEMWGTIRRAARFLLTYRDGETGLCRPTVDLWEENSGEFAYSATAVFAGLQAASLAARQLGHGAEGAIWSQAAGEMREKILAELWDAGLGRFLRARKITVESGTYEGLAAQGVVVGTELPWPTGRPGGNTEGRGSHSQDAGAEGATASILGGSTPVGDTQVEPPGDKKLRAALTSQPLNREPPAGGPPWRRRRHFRYSDPTVDCSLLGLSYPFLLLNPGDPRMVSTARAIEEYLSAPGVGGIRRYQSDRYRGGNPWIICTLWLGLYQAQLGRLGDAAQALQWAMQNRNHLDLLPEQVDREKGGPAWVVPLTWSHAMFVLLVRELQERGYFGCKG
ncbi:MAG: hypothetical protein M1299_05875 [Firmicutes bacterium]|nr:hypothetical protein [Bacillota bacterium]MCL5039337.1 hypothetical protein [Bacillota bacterium]